MGNSTSAMAGGPVIEEGEEDDLLKMDSFASAMVGRVEKNKGPVIKEGEGDLLKMDSSASAMARCIEKNKGLIIEESEGRLKLESPISEITGGTEEKKAPEIEEYKGVGCFGGCDVGRTIFDKVQVVITPVRRREHLVQAKPITPEDLDRLVVLQKRYKDIHAEGSVLVGELEKHLEDFVRKILLTIGLSFIGSVSVGVLACSTGLLVAILHCILLFTSFLPIFAIAWGRVLGTLYLLSLVRERENTLFGLVSPLRTHFFERRNSVAASPTLPRSDDIITTPSASCSSSVAVRPPGSPEVPADVRYRTDIDRLIASIRLDLRGYRCWYVLFMVAMSLIGVAYCVGGPWLFYTRVCAGGKAMGTFLQSWSSNHSCNCDAAGIASVVYSV